MQLGVSVERFQTEYGLPGGHEEHHEGEEEDEEEEEEEEDHDEEGGVRINLDQTRVDAHLAVLAPFSGIEKLRVRLADVDYRHVEIEPNGEVATLFENDGLEARLELLNAPLAGFQGAFGLQLEDQSFSAVGEEAFVIPVDREALALFAYQTRPMGEGQLELGARVETVDYDPSQGVSRDFDLFSLRGPIPTASRGVVLSPPSRISRSGPQSLRRFTRMAPHLATQTFELGDDSLGEERATNLTLTVDGAMGEVELRASAYLTEFSDFLYLRDQGIERTNCRCASGLSRMRGSTAEGEALFHLLESEGSA